MFFFHDGIGLNKNHYKSPNQQWYGGSVSMSESEYQLIDAEWRIYASVT